MITMFPTGKQVHVFMYINMEIVKLKKMCVKAYQAT